MALPTTLKNFSLYVDGAGYQGKVEEAKPPKLARKMDEYRGGGMSGSVMIDKGLDKLEMEFTLTSLQAETMKTFGTPKADGLGMRLVGAYQDETTGAVITAEFSVRGRLQEIDFGNFKAGDKGSVKYKAALTYFKFTENNQERMEFDVLNMIERVDGKDLLADQRRALGMN